MAQASESDFGDVTRQLGPSDLQHLFFELGIKHKDIEHAEESSGTNDRRLRARAVLRWWKKTKGHEATRDVILQALQNCELVDAREELEDLWSRKDGTDTPSTSGLSRKKGEGNKTVYDYNSAKRRRVMMHRDISVTFRDNQASGGPIYILEQRFEHDFNSDSDSVEHQLIQEYKDTRGKLPLLPGMPEECADMEDLFVDLELIQEKKKPTGVIPTKLKSYDELVALKKEKDGKSKHRKGEERDTKSDIVKRLLIRGNPGAGKSTTVSKLAFDWACKKKDSPINNYKLLFAITINEIGVESSLIDIIQDQLLPAMSQQSLRQHIQSNASSVLFLFDGYDEASQYFHRCKDIQHVLKSKWLQESCVIVTTRPNKVADFVNRYGPFTQVEVKGFSEKNRAKYVAKFFSFHQTTSDISDENGHSSAGNDNESSRSSDESDCSSDDSFSGFESDEREFSLGSDSDIEVSEKEDTDISTSSDIGDGSADADAICDISDTEECHDNSSDYGKKLGDKKAKKFLEAVKKTPRISQLASMPIILSMLCLLWEKDRKLPTSLTSLYKDLIMHLAKHKYAKYIKSELNPKSLQVWIDDVLFEVGQVAITGLYKDELIFDANSFNTQQLEEACLLGVVIRERKRSRLSVVHHVTFLHKTFQEVCAAFYWGQLCESDNEKFDRYLRQVTRENIHELEYLLRFSCGLNVKACETILPHVVKVMCENQEKFKGDTTPLFLLFEAETNNAEEADTVQRMNTLLKPLYATCDFILNLEKLTEEMATVLDFYTASSQTSDCDQHIHKHCWFANIEKARVHGYTKGSTHFDRVVKVLACMTHVTILHISGGVSKRDARPLLDNLLKNQFEARYLKELHIDDVTVDSNQVLMHLSRMPSLNKLTLKWVKFKGALTCSLTCKSLKELHCHNCSMTAEFLLSIVSNQIALSKITLATIKLDDWHALFNFFVQTGKRVTEQPNQSQTPPSKTSLALEELDLHDNTLDDSVYTLAKGIGYMSNLTDLNVSFLNTSEYGKLFDGLIESGEMEHNQDSTNVESDVFKEDGLPLKYLDLSFNDIGESVEKLAKALKYMPHLKGLGLCRAGMTASQMALLFNGLVEIGTNREIERVGGSTLATDVINHSNLVIEGLNINGNEIGGSVDNLVKAYQHMTKLKSIQLRETNLNASQCGKLFNGFIEAGDRIERKSGTSEVGLGLRRLDLYGLEIGDSVGKLSQAYKYMIHLECVYLDNAHMNPSQCGILFDGFIKAGKRMQESEARSPTSDASKVLPLKELQLNGNEIADSVDKLAEAFVYMPHLKCLNLEDAHMTSSHCAVLFDMFLSADQRLQGGLCIEELSLSRNEIGDSVGKLLQALKCMSDLRHLVLSGCAGLEENHTEHIDQLLGDTKQPLTQNNDLEWKSSST